MTIIGLKELRQNATEIAERAQNGETFIVVKRSQPMFKLIPFEQTAESSQELKDWTKEAIGRYRPALEALSKK